MSHQHHRFATLFHKYVANPRIRGTFNEDFTKHLKLTELYEHDNHKAVYLYRVPSNNINIQGVMHGGALATLVDLTTTISILKVTPLRTVTISLATEFLSVSKLDDELRLQTTVKKAGKNVVFTECHIYLGDQLACTGSHIKSIMKDNWDFL